jgi:hypothetical protein
MVIFWCIVLYEKIKKIRVQRRIREILGNDQGFASFHTIQELLRQVNLDINTIPFVEEEMRFLRVIEVTIETFGEDKGFPDCSICLEDLKVGDKAISVPKCSHWYHETCLKGWLRVQPICPMCKSNVRSAIYGAVEEEV